MQVFPVLGPAPYGVIYLEELTVGYHLGHHLSDPSAGKPKMAAEVPGPHVLSLTVGLGASDECLDIVSQHVMSNGIGRRPESGTHCMDWRWM